MIKTDNDFTEEEVTTAKTVRDAIINGEASELKSIYMAGEICMWDEMRQFTTPAAPLVQFKSANDSWYKNEPVIVEQTGETVFIQGIDGGNFNTINAKGEKKMYSAGCMGVYELLAYAAPLVVGEDVKKFEHKVEVKGGHRHDYEDRYLKLMGNDGWELVTVVEAKSPVQMFYYWKREQVPSSPLDSGLDDKK